MEESRANYARLNSINEMLDNPDESNQRVLSDKIEELRKLRQMAEF